MRKILLLAALVLVRTEPRIPSDGANGERADGGSSRCAPIAAGAGSGGGKRIEG